MKALLIVLAVVVLLFVAGWLTFGSGDGEASLNLETERIQQDTSELIEEGRQAVQGVDEKVDVQVHE